MEAFENAGMQVTLGASTLRKAIEIKETAMRLAEAIAGLDVSDVIVANEEGVPLDRYGTPLESVEEVDDEQRKMKRRQAIHEFYRLLKSTCESVSLEDNCARCGMRLFCHTPPKGVTADMLDQVMDCLENGIPDLNYTR